MHQLVRVNGTVRLFAGGRLHPEDERRDTVPRHVVPHIHPHVALLQVIEVQISFPNAIVHGNDHAKCPEGWTEGVRPRQGC